MGALLLCSRATWSSHAHRCGLTTFSLDLTISLVLLDSFLAYSNGKVTKDEAALWVSGADDAVSPAPLAMWASPITLSDESIGTFVSAKRQTHFDSTSSTLYTAIARLSRVDHRVGWPSG